MNYIDLCCGIGGFHQAMDRLEKNKNIKTKCLFAADNDPFAAKVYKNNYKIDAFYDLSIEETKQLILESIDKGNGIDFLLAGFPCQSFSKAGKQEGFENKVKGTLFFEIYSIAKQHRPPFILLENVRNLVSHNNGDTWTTIKKCLNKLGYVCDYIIISPNEIPNKKVPALRERIFIMCYHKDSFNNINYNNFFKGRKLKKNKTSIYSNYNGNKHLKRNIFINNLNDEQLLLSSLEDNRGTTIQMWNDLRNRLLQNGGYIISPLWPHFFCESINIKNEPKWKQTIINRNRKFYRDNKTIYDNWYSDWKIHFDTLNASDKKFEWNAGDNIELDECIVQFRPSGVRVKKGDTIPTLVAINQKPILCSEMRYMLPEEMSNLYGFKKLDFGNQNIAQSYKQMGNTVSVDVVEFLINHMLETVGYREEELVCEKN